MVKCLILLLSFNLYASSEMAIQMIPNAKVYELQGRDIILKTLSGTKVRVEFQRNGELEEAKGMNLNRGDEFEPGDGLISLGTAAKHLGKRGISPEGNWRLSKDKEFGWIYEFGKNLVNAKSGDVLSQ